MQVNIRTNQAIKLTFAPVDGQGNPAPLDGKLQGVVLEGSAEVRTVGTDLYIIPSDTAGTAKIEISGDAQEGPEVELIKETIDLTTANPNAVSLGLGFAVIQKTDVPAAE